MVHASHPEYGAFVKTIKERCRVCYTCVRECPAKAIRISDGQAEVLGERCIACGNCVRVCSQQAKHPTTSIPEVKLLLAGNQRVAACLAPSFPADFTDMAPEELAGRIRKLGFDLVTEVAFGADLVAAEYRKLLASSNGNRYIATSCPAIVGFVERYHPGLVPNLAPIVSPMIAQARALRRIHGDDLKIVFVGPCIAKKSEGSSDIVEGEIDSVLTFVELRQMFEEYGLDRGQGDFEPGDFDAPRPGAGALFSISRGLLQAADIREDLMEGQVVAAEGRSNFMEAIREFEDGALDARLLEVLCCDGCIMGAGMSTTAPLFRRRSKVSQYVRDRMQTLDKKEWEKIQKDLAGLNLRRTYRVKDQRIAVPSDEELRVILKRMGKECAADELNCGACGYDTCRDHAVAIFKGLAESEMCLPYMIEELKNTNEDLAVSHKKLASAQEALMQSEKLAGMGQLAAGIAHEVNNPLGVILMYSHILLEESKNAEYQEDLQMIVEQADRCKKIVAGLLNFARKNKVDRQPTDLVDLMDRSLRAVPAPENVQVKVENEEEQIMVSLDRDQMTQVLVNLVSNAYAAMPEGGHLTVQTGLHPKGARVAITDSGVGIPKNNLGKIFDPFFTTKSMGQGTGLGLAVTYGIVKMHRGDIQVRSNADPDKGPTGTTFEVTLPLEDSVDSI